MTSINVNKSSTVKIRIYVGWYSWSFVNQRKWLVELRDMLPVHGVSLLMEIM